MHIERFIGLNIHHEVSQEYFHSTLARSTYYIVYREVLMFWSLFHNELYTCILVAAFVAITNIKSFGEELEWIALGN